ncbi:J domain-containing protein [Thermomonas paludicola]|uniref:J domain-containing protein n=1 Tax=Thermomonas paludicola TaxID=2884874 RepID=UPI002115A1E5|nr:J domain-containing protein [Thermomonas paludicola]
MTWVEMASIAAGLGIGYWLVTVFTHRPDDADIEMPPPDAVEETSDARPWHEVLEVSEWASDEEVTAAYRARITQYHPDKVATLGAEIRALAALKAREINDAYRNARRRH